MVRACLSPPLPGFVTDASESQRFIGDRVMVPLRDEDATVTYCLAAMQDRDSRWLPLLDWVAKRLVA